VRPSRLLKRLATHRRVPRIIDNYRLTDNTTDRQTTGYEWIDKRSGIQPPQRNNFKGGLK